MDRFTVQVDAVDAVLELEMLKVIWTSRPEATLPVNAALSWPEVRRYAIASRLVAFLLLLGTCLMFYTWSRIDATETALLLDNAREQAVRLQKENEWLLLERAALLDVGTLNSRASRLGLVPIDHLVEVH